MKVLLNSFHLNGHTLGFYPLTQKLEATFMFDIFYALQEDKIETLKRTSRLIHYCTAPLLFHPAWRRLRSSSGPENTTVMPDEAPTEEKREKSKERKISKAQKENDGECKDFMFLLVRNSYIHFVLKN